MPPETCSAPPEVTADDGEEAPLGGQDPRSAPPMLWVSIVTVRHQRFRDTGRKRNSNQPRSSAGNSLH